jgi:hypothetical protein
MAKFEEATRRIVIGDWFLVFSAWLVNDFMKKMASVGAYRCVRPFAIHHERITPHRAFSSPSFSYRPQHHRVWISMENEFQCLELYKTEAMAAD